MSDDKTQPQPKPEPTELPDPFETPVVRTIPPEVPATSSARNPVGMPPDLQNLPEALPLAAPLPSPQAPVDLPIELAVDIPTVATVPVAEVLPSRTARPLASSKGPNSPRYQPVHPTANPGPIPDYEPPKPKLFLALLVMTGFIGCMALAFSVLAYSLVVGLKTLKPDATKKLEPKNLKVNEAKR